MEGDPYKRFFLESEITTVRFFYRDTFKSTHSFLSEYFGIIKAHLHVPDATEKWTPKRDKELMVKDE